MCMGTIIVYNMRTQKLKFVAPMPEQIGITTKHFPKGQEPHIEICHHQMLGELDQIDDIYIYFLEFRLSVRLSTYPTA